MEADPVDSCLKPSEIGALLTGTLLEPERVRAEDHLTHCARCRTEVQARQEEERLQGIIQDPQELETPLGTREAETVWLEAPPLLPKPLAVDAIEGYTLLTEIHRGGQGVVYKALQQTAKRLVALKLLLYGPYASIRQRQRFEREISVVAALRHPNIVTLYDSGVTADGRHYFVMEHIAGRSLNAYLADQQPGRGERLALFREICAAVNYAHQHGVIHRDLKPGNILVDESGAPHVVDFGLAKHATGGASSDVTATIPGEFMGTLAYASPEQTRGDPHLIDTRSDVYSLGVILYEMLTGRFPYEVVGPLSEVLHGISQVEPRKLSTRDQRIDGELETIVLTALAKDPQRRYQSAGELEEDIGRYLEGLPIRAKRDNVVYVVVKRLRHTVARHAVAFHGMVVVLTSVLSYLSNHTPLLPWRPLDRAFEHKAIAWRRGLVAPDWPDNLVVVAMEDTTVAAIRDLAQAENLTEVSLENFKSWRVLHGALMQRLAQAHPQIVAWDIYFQSPEPRFDPAFVSGMRALQEKGTKVVLTFAATDEENRPLLSPPVAAQADGMGSAMVDDPGGVVRSAYLAIDQPPYPIVPSFALAIFAACRHPGFQPHWVWETYAPFLEVRYTRVTGNGPQGTQWLPDVDRIWIAHQREEPTPPAGGPADRGRLRKAFFWITVPERDVLARHTIPYHEVFGADDATLRRWFAGKLVLIGDNRLKTHPKPDRRPLAGRAGTREEFSCFIHAAVLSDLLAGATARIWTPEWAGPVLFLAALLGVGLGLYARDSRKRWYACLVGALLVGLTIGGGLMVAVRYDRVIRPSAVVLALVLSAAGAAWVAGVSGKRRKRLEGVH